MKETISKFFSRKNSSWYVCYLLVPIFVVVVLMLSAVLLNYFVPGNTIIRLFGLVTASVSMIYGACLIFYIIGSMLRSVWHDSEEYTSDENSPSCDEIQSSKNTAITILGLTTGALGFGMFGAKLKVDTISTIFSPESSLLQIQIISLYFAIAFYLATLKSVHVILMERSPTSRDVARRPLFGMSMVMAYLISAFCIGAFV